MLRRWEKKLDIFAPLEQAARCLDIWLRQEKRRLTAGQKQRAAALIARYFHYEDEVTDQLMLSFLRHYSGRHDVDMEDPASVRMEIKAVLDKSHPHSFEAGGGRRILAAFAVMTMIMAAALGAGAAGHKKITREQQTELKALVHKIADLDQSATHAAVWSAVKVPLQVRSYQDITWWDYRQSRKALERRLDDLQ